MKTAVVTGGSRGIGYSLCRQLKDKGYKVFGSCRKPTPELKNLGIEVVEGVDVGVDGGVAPLGKAVGSTKVDLLICNAGILQEDALQSLSIESIRQQFEVNTLGPIRTVQQLLPNLQRGSKVVVVTSRMGSIADGSGGDYGYRISKAGVNMAFSSLAHDLKKEGIAVGILHPGFVLTDMTKHYAGMSGLITPDDSAAGMLEVIDKKLSMNTTGTFWHKNGSELPW